MIHRLFIQRVATALALATSSTLHAQSAPSDTVRRDGYDVLLGIDSHAWVRGGIRSSFVNQNYTLLGPSTAKLPLSGSQALALAIAVRVRFEDFTVEVGADQEISTGRDSVFRSASSIYGGAGYQYHERIGLSASGSESHVYLLREFGRYAIGAGITRIATRLSGVDTDSILSYYSGAGHPNPTTPVPIDETIVAISPTVVGEARFPLRGAFFLSLDGRYRFASRSERATFPVLSFDQGNFALLAAVGYRFD